jgi:peptidoglycan/xylan/chitin deacetylase (PgdA/CDA1 family)
MHQISPTPDAPATPASDAATASPATAPTVLVSALEPQPNEMGRIPIVMYHSIGEAMKGKVAILSARTGLNVPTATFHKQLDAMWRAGWYPMDMRDVLSAHIAVPRGKTPVVLTFDDARKSQFRYLKDGRIDPTCAVGVLLAFHNEHPVDWPLRASFYVLPQSQYNPAPFGQRGLEVKKIRFLVENGFEVANHSTSHHMMRNMTATQLRWEMTQCLRYFRERVPTATMDTMALPYGVGPHDMALWNVLLCDEPIDPDATGKTLPDALEVEMANGEIPPNATYFNRCVLLAGGNPSFAPCDRRFDIRQVMRISTAPGSVEYWVKALKRDGAGRWPAFVSDGDPDTVTVPSSLIGRVDRDRLDGARLVVYASPTVKSPRGATATRHVHHHGAPKPDRIAPDEAPPLDVPSHADDMPGQTV